jgi:hypothetical protein
VGGFIFLLANRKGQGALLLFLFKLVGGAGGDGRLFFQFSLFSNVFPRCSI